MKEIKLMLPPEVQDDEARLYLMMKLYEVGKLSLGQAAKLSGYSKVGFMEILDKNQIAVIDYPASLVSRYKSNKFN